MSEIFDKLKKTNAKANKEDPGSSEIKGMEISDMKRQILERLKEKKAAASAAAQVEKPAVIRDDILNVTKGPAPAKPPEEQTITKKDDRLVRQYEKLRAEHKMALSERDEAAKLLRRLRSETDVKEKLIQGLQKKAARMNELEEALRLRDKRITEVDRLAKDFETAKKLSEEYRVKFEAVQSEAKKLAAMHGEAAGRHGELKDELGQRDTFVQDLQKKFASEVGEITRDRDRAASNVESLRSKLYTATKEAKEQLTKITQLEEALRGKEKRMLELENLHTGLGTARGELELRLRAAENDNKNLEEKIARLNNEFGGGRGALAQLQDAYKELEASHNETNLQLQASLRGNKDLEARVGQMRLELDAKMNRLSEADKLYKELETAMRDLTSKFQTSQRKTKELEASNEDIALQLQNMRRGKEDLNSHIAQLNLEIEAKTIRLDGADKLHKETESMIKDAVAKLQVSQRRTGDLERERATLAESLKTMPHKLKETEDAARNEIEKLGAELAALKNVVKQKERDEIELKASMEHLESEMQARDSKIEGDLRYTDKIVKEIGELRKKLAAFERQAKG